MVVLDDMLFRDIRLRILKRLTQHVDNLRLWESSYLAPTEPDPHERECVVRELRACVRELNALALMFGCGDPEIPRPEDA